jgi:hypothetical protein
LYHAVATNKATSSVSPSSHTTYAHINVYAMPSTRSKTPNKPSSENIRTAIIVGVIISLFGLLILTYLFYQQRLRRGVKAGAKIGSRESVLVHGGSGRRGNDGEKGLETGVIQEPLPMYQREPMKDERRLEMAARSITMT